MLALSVLLSCDLTGDCNLDGTVSVAELISGVNIALRVNPLSSCYEFDDDGDREVDIVELVRGVEASINPVAHPNSQTDAPSFGADGRHLTSSSPGSNDGSLPSSVANVNTCRADKCDQDGHSRPIDSAYDMGAFEGNGAGGPSATCNFDPGECAVPTGGSGIGPGTVTLDVGDAAGCNGDPIVLPITMTKSPGAADVAGIEFEIVPFPGNVYPPDAVSDDHCVPGPDASPTMAVKNRPLNLGEPDRLYVMVFDITGNPVPEGEIVRCDAVISPIATTMTETVNLENMVAVTDTAIRFTTNMQPGEVLITNCGCE